MGVPSWAYLHLPRKPNGKRAKWRRVEPGMIPDINKEARAHRRGAHSPSLVTLDDINTILAEHGLEPIKEAT